MYFLNWPIDLSCWPQLMTTGPGTTGPAILQGPASTEAGPRLVAACKANPLGLVASGADPGSTNHHIHLYRPKFKNEGMDFFLIKTLRKTLAIIMN